MVFGLCRNAGRGLDLKAGEEGGALSESVHGVADLPLVGSFQALVKSGGCWVAMGVGEDVVGLAVDGFVSAGVGWSWSGDDREVARVDRLRLPVVVSALAVIFDRRRAVKLSVYSHAL
jgi:hypothetical protein